MFRLIFSDFHLGTGRYNADGSLNFDEDFHHDKDFADLLSYYSNGRYEREEAEIIFNGDTFNLIQTVAENLEEKEYITEEDIYNAMYDTIQGHSLFFKAISDFFARRKGGRVVFITGNHDQPVLHKPLQELISRKVSAEVVFVPLFYEFHGIYCEHGHNSELINRYDPFSIWYRVNGKRVLKMPWGNHFVVQVIAKFKKEFPVIDKVKPFRHFLRWGLLFKPIFTSRIFLNMVWFYIKNRFFNPYPEHRALFKVNFSALADGIMHRNIYRYVKALARKGKKAVILGHTHIPVRRCIYGVEYMNPGTWIDIESIEAGSLARRWEKTFVLIEENGGVRMHLKIWRGMRRIKEEFR